MHDGYGSGGTIDGRGEREWGRAWYKTKFRYLSDQSSS